MLMAARRGAFLRVPAIQKSREEGGGRREEKGEGVRVGRGSENAFPLLVAPSVYSSRKNKWKRKRKLLLVLFEQPFWLLIQ